MCSQEENRLLKIPYPGVFLNKYNLHESRKGFHKIKRGNTVITKSDLYHFHSMFLIPR